MYNENKDLTFILVYSSDKLLIQSEYRQVDTNTSLLILVFLMKNKLKVIYFTI